MTEINTRIQQVEALIVRGKNRQAEFILHQLLEAYPKNSKVNFILGLIALEAGVVIQAEELFRRALQELPNHPDIHYYIGLCLKQQNRFEDAIKAFEFALSLSFRDEKVKNQIKIQRDHCQQCKPPNVTEPIKVALLTTVWKRPDVTKFVLEYYNAAKKDHDVDLIKLAVGSEGNASRSLCESTGWLYLEYDNRPLSNKWQAGLNMLKPLEPDFIITIGSDDIITPDYLRKITNRCPADGCTGIYDFWFLDIASRRMGYWSERKRSTPFGGGYIRTLGAGRCYSKKLLEDLDWGVWPEGYDNKLDGLAEMKMMKVLHRKPTCYSMQDLGSWALDIKSGQNLWNFDDYKFENTLKEEKTESLLMDLELHQILEMEMIAP